MRNYTIRVTPPSGAVRTWTSLPNGVTDTGALNVEFDVPTAPYASPMGDTAITIWGVSLQDIAQASNFNGMKVDLYGGMQKGLPLANPAQQGLLMSGTIRQAFGNWQGTDMTLEFVVNALDESATTQANIVFNWQAGTPLAQAIASTLTTAYPSYKQQITISPNLVLAHTEAGYYHSLTEFAQYLEGITVNLFGTTYQGVQVTLRENTFVVFDGSGAISPIQFQFTDFVGQPTWYGSGPQIQIATVMRGDIQVGNYVTLPVGFSAAPGMMVTQASSNSQYANRSAFQGTFQVTAARHIGNFRDPDGRSWVSVFNCVAA